jgi:hypothetical protein
MHKESLTLYTDTMGHSEFSVTVDTNMSEPHAASIFTTEETLRIRAAFSLNHLYQPTKLHSQRDGYVITVAPLFKVRFRFAAAAVGTRLRLVRTASILRSIFLFYNFSVPPGKYQDSTKVKQYVIYHLLIPSLFSYVDYMLLKP